MYHCKKAQKEISFSPQNNGKDIFLYGHHPVVLALSNPNRKIKEIFAIKNVLNKITIPEHIPIHLVSRDQIETIVGKEAVHQGIVARCQPLNGYNLIDLLNQTKQQPQTLVIILDQVTDPHNIGAILRSAVAFHAAAVIIPQDGAPEENGVLAKSASGALELIPLIRVKNLVRTMAELKNNGFWCIGFDGYAEHSIYQTHLPKKCALIMGSEGEGLRHLTAKNCDDMVKLPMDKRVESLNVSNASAIALYEWNRQYFSEINNK